MRLGLEEEDGLGHKHGVAVAIALGDCIAREDAILLGGQGFQGLQ
jgi:hypothetical protein